MNPHVVTAVFTADEPMRTREEVDAMYAELEIVAFSLGLRLTGLSADIERRQQPRSVKYPAAA